MSHPRSRLATVAVLGVQLSLLVVTALAIQDGDPYVAVQAGVGFLVTTVPWLLRQVRGVPVPGWLEVAIGLALAAHTAGILGLYGRVVWFDNLTHLTSSAVLAAIGCTTARAIDDTRAALRLTPVVTFVYLFAFVLTASVLWELAEFLATVVTFQVEALPARRVQGGLYDTMTDFVFATIGAALVAVVGAVRFDPSGERPTGVSEER